MPPIYARPAGKLALGEKRLYYPHSYDVNRIPSKRAEHVDKYLYFLHIVYMSRIRDRRLTSDDFVPINAEVARRLFNTKLFPKIKQFWIKEGVIQENGSYQVGSHSKSYRFAPAWQSVRMVDRGYHCPVFRAKVNDLQRQLFVQHDTPVLDFLAHNLAQLRIDMEAAQQYLVSRWLFDGSEEAAYFPGELYDDYLQYATAIHQQDFNQKRDTVGNRVHNNLTNFPSELRQFLSTEDGEQLYNFDIRCSQPTLLAALLRRHAITATDVDEYTRLVESGNLYEAIAEAGGVAVGDRKAFKQRLFAKVLFGETRFTEYAEEWQLFRRLFPTVAAFIKQFKAENGYVALPVTLQQIESRIIVDGVLTQLARRHGTDCFALSIHDSVTCTSEQKREVKELMLREFQRYGIRPTIKEEVF